MFNQQSSRMKYLVLGDSHVKFIRGTYSTSTYSLVTRSIPGLKWIDSYDRRLSMYALLSQPEIQSSLSESNAVLFFIGTNSVRILTARKIISQVQYIISLVQRNYPYLNQPGKISVSLTVPCFKTTRRFPDEISLVSNIFWFNEELKSLSSEMNFNILDLEITNNHLADDNMHIHARFHNRIFDSIINHFDQMIQIVSTRSMTSTTTANTSSSSPLPSASSLNQVESTQNSQRSREAIDRRNKKCFERLKEKRKNHTIKRKIHYGWRAEQIKQYLDLHHVKNYRIPPVYNKILRIVFNSQADVDLANEHLAMNAFDESHFQEFINRND